MKQNKGPFVVYYKIEFNDFVCPTYKHKRMRIQIKSSETFTNCREAFEYIFDNMTPDTRQGVVCDILSNPALTKDDLLFTCKRGTREYDHLLTHVFAKHSDYVFIQRVIDILDSISLLDVNRVSDNESPLIFFAAQCTNDRIVQCLLDKGAKVLDSNGEFLKNMSYEHRHRTNLSSYTHSEDISCVIAKHILSSQSKIGMSVVQWAQSSSGKDPVFDSIVNKFITTTPDAVYTHTKTRKTTCTDTLSGKSHKTMKVTTTTLLKSNHSTLTRRVDCV